MYEVVDGVKRKIEFVHKSKIKNGDCIFHNGNYKTINDKYIVYDAFMGLSLFGDTFILGTKLVKRVLFPKWHKGEIVRYQAQI